MASSAASEEQPGASGSQGISKEESDQNPFEMNGQCQANRTKLGTLFAVGESTLQPPEAPVKPLTPYMRLYGKVVNEVKAANQTLGGQSNPKEIHQIIRKKWEELCDIDKEGFTKETETEMVEYERNLKAYHDSPAYQSYITGKSQAQQGANEKESEECLAAAPVPETPTKKQTKKKARQKMKKEARQKVKKEARQKVKKEARALKKQEEVEKMKAEKNPSGSSDLQYRTDSDGFQSNVCYPHPKQQPELGQTPNSQAGPSTSTEA